MEYTVNQLARLSGVTRRTLHHYDQIGLLRPARGDQGYRLYGPGEVDRLQQILFYRALGLPLAEVKDILDAPDYDPLRAIQQHLAGLERQKQQLESLIQNAQKTLQSLKGEQTMQDNEKFAGFKESLIRENEEKYGEEIRQKYGDDTVDASNAKMMNMTQEQYERFEALGEKLNAALAAAVRDGDPAGALGQQAAALHKEWLCFTWPQYSAEAHRNLALMYTEDPRFAAYYEKIAPGAAQFLREAIEIYTTA